MTARKPISIRRMEKMFFYPGFIVFFCMQTALAQRATLFIPPEVFDTATVERMAQSHQLVRWTNAAGTNIGFKRMSPTQPSRGSIMLLYGYGSSATDSGYYADNIQNVAALDIYILEYPGYEDRPGSSTPGNVFAAAGEGFEMLPADKPIYLVGESFGTGVAAQLAKTFPDRIAGIILLSPFDNLKSVAHYHFPLMPTFLPDPYPSTVNLRKFHGKLGVTVDGRDVVVPQKFGLRLYNAYDGPKKLWEFPEGGHCEIRQPPDVFWRDAIDFLQNGPTQ